MLEVLRYSPSTARAGEVSGRTEGARVVQRAQRPVSKDASFAYPLRPAFAGHLPRPGGGGDSAEFFHA
ncbi:hypothetical protein LIHA111178_04345 [Litorimonas haliclonae]